LRVGELVQDDDRGARAPGLVRRLIFGAAVFALLVAGVHGGADRLADLLFGALNFADQIADLAFERAIHAVLGALGAETSTIERAADWAMSLVDLPLKLSAAKYAALALELTVDLILLPAALTPALRAGDLSELRRALNDSFRDPTLLRFASPLAVGAAAVAGVGAVAREIEAGAYPLAFRAVGALVSPAPPDRALAGALSRGAGLGALALSAAWLTLPAVFRAMIRADRIARNERLTPEIPPRARRLRGLWTALVALPVALLAASESSFSALLRALVVP
jgi:hypothetical protein